MIHVQCTMFNEILKENHPRIIPVIIFNAWVNECYLMPNEQFLIQIVILFMPWKGKGNLSVNFVPLHVKEQRIKDLYSMACGNLKKFKFVHGIYNNMTKRTIRQEDITFWYIQINMVTKLRLSVSLSMICKSSLWPFHMKFLSSRDKRDMKNYRWFLCVTRGRSPFTLTYIRQLALLKMDFSLHLASKINFLQEIYYHETKQWKYKYFP